MLAQESTSVGDGRTLVAALERAVARNSDSTNPDQPQALAEAARAGPPTLKTLSALTGYSVAAVSRALSDAPDIGREAKERVRAAALKVGYRPNLTGLRLRTGKTNVISLVLNTDEEILGLTSKMINGISDRLRDTSYQLVVTPYSLSDDPLAPVRYVIDTHAADGVILSRTEPVDARVALLAARGLPFVTHGRTEMDVAHPWYDYDNERFASDAVRELAGDGATRVSLFAPPSHLTYQRHLAKGFHEAAEALGLATVPFDCATIEDDLDAVEAAVTAMMAVPGRPDGIVCTSGSGAIAVVSGIEAAGLVVGRDVRIASKQSGRVLNRIRPSIRTHDEDFRHAGWNLADLLLQSIDGAAPQDLQRLVYR